MKLNINKFANKKTFSVWRNQAFYPEGYQRMHVADPDQANAGISVPCHIVYDAENDMYFHIFRNHADFKKCDF